MKKFLSLAFCVMILSVGCGKKQEAPVQEVVRPIKVLELAQPSSEMIRTYPGQIEASDTAKLAFQDSGKVIELPVEQGQEVKKGDLLAKIDPRDFEQALAAAQAAYTEAQRNVERLKGLHVKELVSTAELQRQEKDTEVLLSELQNAKKALQDTELRAPFDGVVSQKLIKNFQNVIAGDVAIRVQDIEQLKVKVHVPEHDAATAAKDSAKQIKGTATFSAVPGRTFPLKVHSWETEADPGTQTFLVEFKMDQPEDLNILPGMTAEVRVEFPKRDAQETEEFFSVPVSSVFSDEQGQACVWVVDPVELTVHKRAVKAGEVTGVDQVKVAEGLKTGETIAVTAASQLREGMKVSLIDGKI